MHGVAREALGVFENSTLHVCLRGFPHPEHHAARVLEATGFPCVAETHLGIDREAGRCFVAERAKADKVRSAPFELPSLFLSVVQQRMGGDDVFSRVFGRVHSGTSDEGFWRLVASSDRLIVVFAFRRRRPPDGLTLPQARR